MKKLSPTELAGSAGSFELGKILGQQNAFSLVAGRCSAAEAAAIQRVRQERLYEASNLSWHDFCPRHFGMSRTRADRLIGHLEEFGPQFFEVTQLTRITPGEYRIVAPAVQGGQIHWKGEAIALIPENRERVAAAVAGLREAARPAALEPPAPPAGAVAVPATANRQAIEALTVRSGDLVGEWSKLVQMRCSFAPEDRQAMRNMIGHTKEALARLERQVWWQPAGVH